MRLRLTFLAMVVLSITSYAQVRTLPAVVKDSFNARYPQADSVEYHDNLINVQVVFVDKGSRKLANFTNKGVWKQTEREIPVENLSADVRDGYSKSKYAVDWKITSAAIIELPGKPEEYRIKVSKNDLQKKYLYYDASGRLLRDAITL